MREWVAILLLLFSACTASARECDQEVHHLLQRIFKNDFDVDRSLSTYLDYFSTTGLRDAISELKASQTWIDMGSGDGVALREFIQTPRYRGKAIGITAVSRISPAKIAEISSSSKGRLKLLQGRLLENIPNSELPKATIITDVFGPFSYGLHVDETLQKYMDLLEKGGSVYVSYSPQKNFVKLASSDLDKSLIEWLQSVDGIRVSTDSLSEKNIKITKLVDRVTVPKLELESVEDAGPPKRKYISVKASWLSKVLGKLK